MAQFYGLALPMLKRGIPITPVQLENVTLPGFLNEQRVLMLSYQGQKPLSAEVHPPLAEWVRKGGVLVVIDDDKDPYNRVREWWNDNGKKQHTPRQHLFETLAVKEDDFEKNPERMISVSKGAVIWLRESPVPFALSAKADARLAGIMKTAAGRAGLECKETNYICLRRGPYVIAAGLDESMEGAGKLLQGRFVNLFDPELKVQRSIALTPGSRLFLLDLDALKSEKPRLLSSGCRTLPARHDDGAIAWTVEGVGNTPALMLISTAKPPHSVQLDQQPLDPTKYDAAEGLLYLRFPNEARPRNLVVTF